MTDKPYPCYCPLASAECDDPYTSCDRARREAATATGADVERAIALLDGRAMTYADYEALDRLAIQRVAQGLADERASALAPVLALAAGWDTADDARYAHNRIAKSTAARAIRDAVAGESM